MKANEIFSNMKDETAESIFQYLRAEERQVYSAALSGLATNRKLRPIFVQKKAVPDQMAWLVKNVRLKGSAEVAENVLQLWLLKGNSEMLVMFLDGIGVEHDGEGSADEIPESIDAKKLKKTTDSMLKKFGPELVRVYLQMFQMQRAGGWDEITELIVETPELQFGENTAAATTSTSNREIEEEKEE